MKRTSLKTWRERELAYRVGLDLPRMAQLFDVAIPTVKDWVSDHDWKLPVSDVEYETLFFKVAMDRVEADIFSGDLELASQRMKAIQLWKKLKREQGADIVDADEEAARLDAAFRQAFAFLDDENEPATARTLEKNGAVSASGPDGIGTGLEIYGTTGPASP